MKAANLVVFFAVFFSVYGLLNFYIFLRGWEAIPPDSELRVPYLVLFLFLALAFIAGRFLERAWVSPVSTALVWVGSFWLAAMLYFFLAVVLLDLLRLVNYFIPVFPSFVTGNYAASRLMTFLSVTAVVTVILVGGHLNALSPRIREIDLTVRKKTGGKESTLRIVAASDIHLGTIIGRRRLQSIVDRINSLEPDVVLLPGDIVDEDLGPVIRENLGETLRSIRSGQGVFAVTGNHEYIGGAGPACAYLMDHGITMLRDSVARLEGGMYIVGREDRSSAGFGGGKRKTLESLMAGVDTAYPVVLMDHQPFRLEEAAGKGIDIQLSGHTHHGQLWPLNKITEAVYEVSWGETVKGETHFYVSSGVGTWGPPVRTGNRPEIVLIRLRTIGA
jgi:predicted MPP superfamily phosphohydrolase